MLVFEEVLDNVEVTDDDCWLWQRSSAHGYGRVSWRGKNRAVHTLVWQELCGTPPEGLEPDHLCVNTLCANPTHVEWVTQQENLRRKSLRQTHCRKVGHPFDYFNTYIDNRGNRGCKACRVETTRQWRARRRG